VNAAFPARMEDVLAVYDRPGSVPASDVRPTKA